MSAQRSRSSAARPARTVEHATIARSCASVNAARREPPVYLREATERGEVFGLVQMSTSNASFVWLLLDDPRTLRERVREAMKRWSNWGVV